jgi:hypothetical protein
MTEVTRSKQEPIIWTAKQIVELFNGIDYDEEFDVTRYIDPKTFAPMLHIEIPYYLTLPKTVTIAEFDLAYRKYFDAEIRHVADISLPFPEQQYLDCSSYYHDDVGGYMLFVAKAHWESNYAAKPIIQIENVVVSAEGTNITLPEFLNDYI